MTNFAVNQQTPDGVAEALRPHYEGKVVYDLGAGNGNFALQMAQYAKSVVAVELDETLAGDCRMRELETIQDDFLNVNLSQAEVIYIFMSFFGTCALMNRLREIHWTGTVISQYYPLHVNLTAIEPPTTIVYVNHIPYMIYKIKGYK